MVQLSNLNFHQTFPPTTDGISRLLSVADRGGAYTKEEISQMTGIPTGKSSGKVEPYIRYAVYMRRCGGRKTYAFHNVSGSGASSPGPGSDGDCFALSLSYKAEF